MGRVVVFNQVTLDGYFSGENMASFWPTPEAMKMMPTVAEGMNRMTKVVVVNPVILGKGRTMFEGVKDKLTLRLKKTRTFGNGNVVLCYEPMA